jgi:hypothetical protein
VLDNCDEADTGGSKEEGKELPHKRSRGCCLLLDAAEMATRKSSSGFFKVSLSMPSISPNSTPDSTVSLKDLTRSSVFVKGHDRVAMIN